MANVSSKCTNKNKLILVTIVKIITSLNPGCLKDPRIISQMTPQTHVVDVKHKIFAWCPTPPFEIQVVFLKTYVVPVEHMIFAISLTIDQLNHIEADDMFHDSWQENHHKATKMQLGNHCRSCLRQYIWQFLWRFRWRWVWFNGLCSYDFLNWTNPTNMFLWKRRKWPFEIIATHEVPTKKLQIAS